MLGSRHFGDRNVAQARLGVGPGDPDLSRSRRFTGREPPAKLKALRLQLSDPPFDACAATELSLTGLSAALGPDRGAGLSGLNLVPSHYLGTLSVD